MSTSASYPIIFEIHSNFESTLILVPCFNAVSGASVQCSEFRAEEPAMLNTEPLTAEHSKHLLLALPNGSAMLYHFYDFFKLSRRRTLNSQYFIDNIPSILYSIITV